MRNALSYATCVRGGRVTSTSSMGEGKPAGDKLRRAYPVAGSRQICCFARTDTGFASGDLPSLKSVAMVTPRPAASLSKTFAVGLLSPRSTSETMDLLTPDRLARYLRVESAFFW